MKVTKFLAAGQKAEEVSKEQQKVVKTMKSKVEDVKEEISDMLNNYQIPKIAELSTSIMSFSDLLREFENCILDIEQDEDMSNSYIIIIR